MYKKVLFAICGLLIISGCQGQYNPTHSKRSSNFHQWTPISHSKVYDLIGGKTLITKNAGYCPSSITNKECLKIAVLQSPKNRIRGNKLKATIIYPDEKKVIKDTWGYTSYNISTHGLDMGIDLLPVGSRRYPFKRMVSIDQNKKHLKLYNPRSGKSVLITIVRGQNSKFLRDARNSSYKRIDNRGRISIGQAISRKVVGGIVKAAREGTSYTSPANASISKSKSKVASSDASANKTSRKGIKKLYIGSHQNGRNQYVIKCNNGNNHYSINKHSNGYWYSYGSNMGDDYKNLSITGVAQKKCN